MASTKAFVPTPLLDAVLDHDPGLTYRGLEPRHLEIADVGIAFEYQRGDLAAFEALARIPLQDLPLQIVSLEMFLAPFESRRSNPLREEIRATDLHPAIQKASWPHFTQRQLSKMRNASIGRNCFMEPWLRRFVLAALKLRLAGVVP